MNNKEKKEIILKIKSDDRNIKLFPNNVPDEYKNDIDVIKAERKSGMRTIERRGFDVINQRFFIHESVLNYSESF